MKYLFFDTECSNVSKKESNLCSFGYVLVDESLNIIESSDILIKPTKYDDSIMSQIVKYKKEDLEASLPFTNYYNLIKNLITDSDTICIGQSLAFDAKYLNNACKEYNLDSIDFSIFDLAEVYKNIYKLSNTISLDLESKNLNIDIIQGVKHSSYNDAYITYQCIFKLCKINNCNIVDLLNKYHGFKGVSYNFNVFTYEDLFNVSNNMGTGSSNRHRFNYFCKIVKRRENINNSYLKNKKIYISSNYTKTHYKEMFYIVQTIKNNHALYISNKDIANYIVYESINELEYSDFKKKKESLESFLINIDFNQEKAINYYKFVVKYDLLLDSSEIKKNNYIKSSAIKTLKNNYKKFKI